MRIQFFIEAWVSALLCYVRTYIQHNLHPAQLTSKTTHI